MKKIKYCPKCSFICPKNKAKESKACPRCGNALVETEEGGRVKLFS